MGQNFEEETKRTRVSTLREEHAMTSSASEGTFKYGEGEMQRLDKARNLPWVLLGMRRWRMSWKSLLPGIY